MTSKTVREYMKAIFWPNRRQKKITNELIEDEVVTSTKSESIEDAGLIVIQGDSTEALEELIEDEVVTSTKSESIEDAGLIVIQGDSTEALEELIEDEVVTSTKSESIEDAGLIVIQGDSTEALEELIEDEVVTSTKSESIEDAGFIVIQGNSTEALEELIEDEVVTSTKSESIEDAGLIVTQGDTTEAFEELIEDEVVTSTISETQDDVKLLDIGHIVKTNFTSVRLRHGIEMALECEQMPFETVGDYIKAGSNAIRIIKALPNIGNKTAKELDYLIKELVDKSANSKSHKGTEHEESTEALDAVTLLDIGHIVETSMTSERLRNGIKVAMENKELPFVSVGDYIKAGSSAFRIIKGLPNLGITTAKELDYLIKDLVDKSANSTLLKDTRNMISEKSTEHINSVALLDISHIVESNITSERLRNGIEMAVTKEEMPLKTVGDYINAGFNAIRMMKAVPNIGINTAEELDSLIKSVFAHSAEKICLDDDDNLVSVENKLTLNSQDGFERLLKSFKNNLQEREFDIIKCRAIEEKTLEETGRKYDVTRERVRQIEKKAKHKLLKVYEKVFILITTKLDNILDDNYGEVSLLEVKTSLDVTTDVLKFLCIYVLINLMNL